MSDPFAYYPLNKKILNYLMIKCNIEPFTDGNSLQLCMKKKTYLHNTRVRINVSILKSMTYYELSMLSLPVYICYAG